MRKIFLILLCSYTASYATAQTWAELGTESNALQANNSIKSIVIDHSNNVYAAGSFTVGGDYIVSKWDGTSWNELGHLAGSPTKGNKAQIERNCLSIDSSDNVYVTFEGAATPNMILKWSGTNWGYIGPVGS